MPDGLRSPQYPSLRPEYLFCLLEFFFARIHLFSLDKYTTSYAIVVVILSISANVVKLFIFRHPKNSQAWGYRFFVSVLGELAVLQVKI